MKTTIPLSDQLREYIRQAGMSQRQLAFQAGIEPAVLSRFLNRRGGFSIEAIDRLGELLKLRFTQPMASGTATSHGKGN